MLKLTNITKDYKVASGVVHALRGVSLEFRKNEFVCILGQSGCGKTTLLNIIGGLDHYTAGDLVIQGKSTKDFKDRDWDVYRNHRIGFIFQTYNLIPHQTVLANVELALTIAGVGKEERKRRAQEALERVGLGEELNKKPNQLSGGQMQRVAIARALVNNPDILLADEPTGALDSKTSVQIMDLIREIAGERLVIMVTHNPELATQYASRIVRLKDGQVEDDSDPYHEEEQGEPAAVIETESEQDSMPKQRRVAGKSSAAVRCARIVYLVVTILLSALAVTAAICIFALVPSLWWAGVVLLVVCAAALGLLFPAYSSMRVWEGTEKELVLDDAPAEKRGKREKKPRAKMSFLTSLALSAKNLLTKKGRTIITSVAGSIGIISVCLVLALSSGFGTYIRHTEEDMLSYYPLEISESALDVMSVMDGINNGHAVPTAEQIKDKVYINSFLTGLAQGVAVQNNISKEYISYIDQGKDAHPEWFSAVQYGYGFSLADALFTSMTVGGGSTGKTETVRYNSVTSLKEFLIQELINEAPQYTSLLRFVDFFTNVLNKMPGTADFQAEDYGNYVRSQYDLIAGTFPEHEDEAVLVVGENNAIIDLTLVQLGFLTEERFLDLFNAGLTEDGPTATAVTLAETPSEGVGDVDLLSFDDIFAQNYVLYYADELYAKTGKTGTTEYPYEYRGVRNDLEATPEQGISFHISGILRLKSNFTYGCLQEGLNLTEAAIDSYVKYNARNSELVKWMTGEDAELGFSVGGMKMYRSPAQHLNSYYTAFDLSSNKENILGNAFLVLAEQLFSEPIPETKEGILTYFASHRDSFSSQLSMLFGGDTAKAGALLDAISAKCAALDADEEGKVARSDVALALGSVLAEYSEITALVESQGAALSGITYITMTPEAVARVLGGNSAPNDILIYASDFDAKEDILDYLDAWNESPGRAEEDKITYTDRVGLLMGMVQTMLNVITYVLVAFTAISLVVSSVMIGIITYVSVVERVKEIGVLRSLGARKMDIRNLFNAETFIIGLAAGLIGIAVTYIISGIISAIIFSLSGIAGIASLPPLTAFIMVCVSVALTLISGLIPAQAAARKDPVIALRTE